MIKHLYSVLILCFLATASVQAQTYIRDYTYKASDIDSKVTSRANALDQVKVILLQEIGTHIRQEINISQDSSGNSYASEDVEAITAGLTKVDILEEKWNGETYYLKASIDADTERVLNALEEFKKSTSLKVQLNNKALKDNQIALKKARERIQALRKELEAAKSKEKRDRTIDEYEKTSKKYIAAGEMSQALSLFHDKQYKKAFPIFYKLAKSGDGYAQYYVGHMMFFGNHDKKYDPKKSDLSLRDYVNARKWFELASTNNIPQASSELVTIYLSGLGVEKNEFLGNKYLKKSFAQYLEYGDKNDRRVQTKLGFCYANEKCTEKNPSKAVYWLKKAVEQDYITAQHKLGMLYMKGDVVPRNSNKAQYYLGLACETFKKATNGRSNFVACEQLKQFL